MKNNLDLQKKEFEGMVKRLGLNIQDALSKIKNEIKQENREMLSLTENRYDKTIKHLNEDMQNLLLRYDADFKTFSNSINDLMQKEFENQND